MNQITGTIQNIFSDRPLQEDEYRNESDNLIHCAKCKTPRQHQVGTRLLAVSSIRPMIPR